MPTLEDFQNMLQAAEQSRVQQSPLYQRVVQEQMREQQKMQEIPQELLPVFDELRDTQERNNVRQKLAQYNDARQAMLEYADGGSIHISPNKRGTFTAAASRHGMGVQEFASKVLANKENYSHAMVKKANFARNASKWHEFGGHINYFSGGGNASNGQQLWNKARPLYNELIMAGVPHMAAIGVLGNIALESGVNPNASNKVNGGHWGYTQNDKAITDHIRKYYGGNGHKEQMQFLKDGLTGQIRGAKQAPWLQKRFDGYRQGINGINDPAKAALMWEKYYERSANEALDKRADYAKYFHEALGSPDYQYSPDKYNSRAKLGPLVSQTTEEETPELAPWYNQYQLNDADYAALYEQNNTPLPMFDTSLTWNPIQPAQQGGGFPNLFAGGGYIEDGLRSLGVNGFKVTSGYRGPNSKVGKAGKRSGHAHTLKDGSSGAIDIVPVDKSPAGWARLEQQLRQPEVQQFLASFGGTILDERDAATMKKTGATGQHFHIGLGVKGGGNFYNQPGQNYAQRSPISVFSPIQSSTLDDGSTSPWYAHGSSMTDEDWAALYNSSQQLMPTGYSNMFPNLV